jgi:hypothetical protein
MAETKTNGQDNKESAGKKKISLARADDFTLLYADSIQISMSQYDFKLTCIVNQTLLNGDAVVTEFATVIISPLHAKALAESLTKQVAEYEKDIMPLKVNKEFKAKHDASIKKMFFDKTS